MRGEEALREDEALRGEQQLREQQQMREQQALYSKRSQHEQHEQHGQYGQEALRVRQRGARPSHSHMIGTRVVFRPAANAASTSGSCIPTRPPRCPHPPCTQACAAGRITCLSLPPSELMMRRPAQRDPMAHFPILPRPPQNRRAQPGPNPAHTYAPAPNAPPYHMRRSSSTT